MGKMRAPLRIDARQWFWLCSEPAVLHALLQEPGRATDVVGAIAEGLLPGGVLNTADAGLRLHVLSLLGQRAVELCNDAPVDLLRQLYENVRDRTVAPPRDSPAAVARLRQAALLTLTQLLVKLEMPQRDARLVKVHVETLFRTMERSGPHAAATPDLCCCAATCLRLMEEAAPTLLLAGSKQLLELARHEASTAAESYAMLAARVLSNGAACCLDLMRGTSGKCNRSGEQQQQAAVAAAEGTCCKADADREEDNEHDALAGLASIDVHALILGGSSGSDSGSATPAGAHDISPASTLDVVAQGMAAFPSGRTATSSDDLMSSPKEVPGTPRGVASMLGTMTTLDDSACSVLAADAAAQTAAAAGMLAQHPSIASNEMSGSVQLDGCVAQPLLAPSAASTELRHFRVPQHLHWPKAPAHTALCVFLTPEAQADLRQACLEFLAALPLLSMEGVACVTSALPPIMCLADPPQAELQLELDGLLHSGRTLVLQAVLKLHAELPEDFAEWQGCLVDSVLMMINGPHSTEHRVVAATWCLVQHHMQMHGRQPSLFVGTWRQLMPRSDDPVQLLSLKIKALSAALAVGIGRSEEICPMVFAWDGFWQRKPNDQQQRLATYALRMLGSAAQSYAALPAAQAMAAHQRTAAGSAADSTAASKPPATPHYVKACLVSACLQLLATRPQYLPAVEAYLAHCGSCCPQLQMALLNAVDALLLAAATGTCPSLQPWRGAVAVHKQRSGSRLLGLPPNGSPCSGGSPRGSPKAGLGGMLQRVAMCVSQKFSLPAASPGADASSLQQAAEGGGEELAAVLPAIAEVSPDVLAAPQPPSSLQSWEEAEAWLRDSRTWATLSINMLAHDPMAYRSLLLRLAQSGTAVLPMGGLRLLAAYANQYHCEQPGHALPSKEVGNCMLAICEATAMTHLLIGPQLAPASPRKAAAAKPGRMRTHGREADSTHRMDHSLQRSTSPSVLSANSSDSAHWTLQQEEIAAAMQAVLSALASHFPVESVQRRAQSFVDLLTNPSAWDLRLHMGALTKMLGSYFSEAVSIANYL